MFLKWLLRSKKVQYNIGHFVHIGWRIDRGGSSPCWTGTWSRWWRRSRQSASTRWSTGRARQTSPRTFPRRLSIGNRIVPVSPALRDFAWFTLTWTTQPHYALPLYRLPDRIARSPLSQNAVCIGGWASRLQRIRYRQPKWTSCLRPSQIRGIGMHAMASSRCGAGRIRRMRWGRTNTWQPPKRLSRAISCVPSIYESWWTHKAT